VLSGEKYMIKAEVENLAIIPEYLFGLPPLAIFMIIAYGLIRRRTKNPQNI
jgi:hypothetical protein